MWAFICNLVQGLENVQGGSAQYTAGLGDAVTQKSKAEAMDSPLSRSLGALRS